MITMIAQLYVYEHERVHKRASAERYGGSTSKSASTLACPLAYCSEILIVDLLTFF